MLLDRILNGIDLSAVHGVLTFIGLFATVYVMQLSHLSIAAQQPQWLQILSRVGLVFLAWGMLWSLSFSFQKDWEPWPPQLLVYLAVDIIMVSRATMLRMKQKRIEAEVHARSYRAVPR